MSQQKTTEAEGTEKPRLFAITFNHLLFPYTAFKLSKSESKNLFNKFKKIIESGTARFLIAFQNTDGELLEVGVVATVEVKENSFDLHCKSRAKIIKIAKDPKADLFIAEIEDLPDIPSLEELTDLNHEFPLILSCVEAIYRLLTSLYETVSTSGSKSSEDLVKSLATQIAKLKVERREKWCPYHLCWHIVGVVLPQISDDLKLKVLYANKMVERLQIVIDILELETKIYCYQNGLLTGSDVPQINGDQKGK